MNKKFLQALMLSIIVIASAKTTIYAQEKEEIVVEIDNITIDIEKLAEENGVDPYDLKEAIEAGLESEKASPFSNLEAIVPNTEAGEYIEESLTRAAPYTAYKTNQDSTAYVATAGALTASGKTPTVGMCAMHINVTSKTEDTTSTKVKLGTTIVMESPVNINGTSYSLFTVEDRGGCSNRTTYWIDIYFGVHNTANYNAALNYGKQTVSYSYWYR
ncbi:hypothetical protein LJC58_05475 [Lachnospiraceae bacterium OttesenSCG-928-D06]|nr:hypothetical protein [Lachnospiraceae bacterium OttesenSCG-928-D06]